MPRLLLFTLCGVFATAAGAQVCNTPDTLNTANHSGVAVNSGTTGVFSSVTSPANVIGATSANATLNSVVLGSAYIGVTKASPATDYPAGMLAGFSVNNASLLGLLSDITITTYSGGIPQESVSGSSVFISSGLLGSGSYNVGIRTTKTFDNVRITLGGVLSSLDVYYAFVEQFCAGTSLSCNAITTAASPAFPLTVDPAQSGVLGVGTVSNADNAVDNDQANYASITTTVAAATGGSIAVMDNVSSYPAGTFAGFDIASTSLLGLNLMADITISTYSAGTLLESISGSPLTRLNPSLLSSSNGRTIVGFKTALGFDEVKISVSNTLSAAYTIKVYGLVLEKFCAGSALACNMLTPATAPALPVFVDGAHTGINNIITVGGSLDSAQNAVDSNRNNYAQLSLTTGVASVSSFAVADALNTYPAKSFAGFDIELNTQLLAATALSTASISLYNNGVLVQTASGNALIVGATTSLLVGGTTRQLVGIVADTTYDEVKISFNQLTTSNLGNIKIYSAVFENTCDAAIACGTAYYLNNPAFPTVIDGPLTGVSGVATAAANVADAWNVVSADTADYARISNTALVAATASIAVLDPLTTYPKGTFAGFVIKPGSTPAILANLLNAVTISTYNNGALQESHAGAANLINLALLGASIGTPASSYNIGFYTAQEFDEIRIDVGSLVGVGLSSPWIDVYGAFIDTRSSVSGSGAFTCMKVNPDVNAGLVNLIIPGNVSTNDVLPSGATYSNPAGPLSAPAGSSATLTVNAGGDYTFQADKAGVYVYQVPYCLSGMNSGCATQLLTITVSNPMLNTNEPVANTDIATTDSATSVVVDLRANDGPGNTGDTLGTPTTTSGPLHGTASINGSGQLLYTPSAGFTGTDTITYQVCETPSNTCATAKVYIAVNGGNAPVTLSAADDYASTADTSAVGGNVLTNDRSTSGHTLAATPQNITLPGKGTFVLNANGSYTFTPVTSFKGTIDIPYTANDTDAGVSADATLHIVVYDAVNQTPLPVGLLSFSGKADGCDVLLNWETATAFHPERFVLQSSADGSTFMDIASISSKGSDSRYTYVHHSKNGERMYRLAMLDYSGGRTYSPVVLLRTSCSVTPVVQLSPNPVTSVIRLQVSNVSADYAAEAIVYDVTGTRVMSTTIHAGTNSISATSLLPGLYQIVIRAGGENFSYRMVVGG